MRTLYLMQRVDVIGQDANGSVGLGHKVMGVCVRYIVVLLQQLLNFFPCCTVDTGFSVHHAGNRAGRNPCYFCNIINRPKRSLLPDIFVLII